MKAGIHPEYYPVVFIDTSTNYEIVTRSTKKTGETRVIDGVEHYVIRVEISADSHPFFTGKQRFVDTAGRIERFQRKYEKFYADQDKAKAAAEKKSAARTKAAAKPKPVAVAEETAETAVAAPAELVKEAAAVDTDAASDADNAEAGPGEDSEE